MDAEQRQAALQAVREVLGNQIDGADPSPDALVDAVLGTIPDAIVEHATLYTLMLETVDREHATFTAPGGMTLTLHRGDWMERGRPAKLWITAQHALEPYTAV